MGYVAEVLAALEEEGDPRFADLDDAAVERAVRSGAAEIAAATCRWLQVLAELMRRGIWSQQGARTPAEWLSWAVSMGPSTAREHVKVALRLRQFPAVEAEFAAGRISYTKVRAILRCNRPELEELLLTYAEHSTGAQLERIVRGLCGVEERRRDVEDPFEERRLRHFWRDDGMLEVRLILPAEQGLGFVQRVDQRTDQLYREARRAASAEADDTGDGKGPRVPSLAALRADAVVEAVAEMAERLPDDDGSDRHLVTLHVAADALADPGEGRDRKVPVRMSGGRRVPAMSARALRRLACSASLRIIAHDDDGHERGASERRWHPSPRQRRQLAERDRGCRFPGCEATRGLHAHHIVHWADGGATALSNLVLLCHFHHRFVHDRGWVIAHDGRGRFAFRPPHGPVLLQGLPLEGLDPVRAVRGDPDHHDQFDPKSLQARWDGTPPDYSLTVEQLLDAIRRNQSPERVAIAA